MAENVLDFILRARNTQQVIDAFQQVADALRQTKPAADEAGKAFDKAGDEAAEAGKQVQGAAPQLSGFFSQVERGIGSFGRLTASFALAQLGVNGIMQALGNLQRLIRDGIVGGAAEAEQAIKRFNFALAGSGQFSKEASTELQRFAETLAEAVGTSDEEILGVMQRLLQLGDVSVDSIQGVTEAVFDLAAATGRGTEELARLIATFAETGQAGRGLNVFTQGMEKTLDPAERLDTIVANITAKLGGSAADAADTYAGNLKRLREQLGEVGEEIGLSFIPHLEAATKRLIEGAKAFKGWLEARGQTQQFKAPSLIGMIGELTELNELLKRAEAQGGVVLDVRFGGDVKSERVREEIESVRADFLKLLGDLDKEAQNVELGPQVLTQIANMRELLKTLPPDILAPIEKRLAGIEKKVKFTAEAETADAEAKLRKAREEQEKKSLKLRLEVDQQTLKHVQDVMKEQAADAEKILATSLQIFERAGVPPQELVNLETLTRVLPELQAIDILQQRLIPTGEKWVQSLDPRKAFEEWRKLAQFIADVRSGEVTFTGQLEGFEELERQLRAKVEANKAFFAGEPLAIQIQALINEQQFAEADALLKELKRQADEGANFALKLKVEELEEGLSDARDKAARGGKNVATTLEQQFGRGLFTQIGNTFSNVMAGLIADTRTATAAIDNLFKQMVTSILAELARIAIFQALSFIPGLGFLSPIARAAGKSDVPGGPGKPEPPAGPDKATLEALGRIERAALAIPPALEDLGQGQVDFRPVTAALARLGANLGRSVAIPAPEVEVRTAPPDLRQVAAAMGGLAADLRRRPAIRIDVPEQDLELPDLNLGPVATSIRGLAAEFRRRPAVQVGAPDVDVRIPPADLRPVATSVTSLVREFRRRPAVQVAAPEVELRVPAPDLRQVSASLRGLGQDFRRRPALNVQVPGVEIPDLRVDTRPIGTALTGLQRALLRQQQRVGPGVTVRGERQQTFSAALLRQALFGQRDQVAFASVDEVTGTAAAQEQALQQINNFSGILDGADFERYMRTRGLRALSELAIMGRV